MSFLNSLPDEVRTAIETISHAVEVDPETLLTNAGVDTSLAAVTVLGISVAVGSQVISPFSAPAANGVKVSVIALATSTP